MRAFFIGLTALAIAFAAPTKAEEPFEGRYRISGTMPDTQTYEGVAQIKQSGETYVVVWKVDEVLYYGSGVRSGDVISIVFMPLNANARPGIASLRIVDNHVADGSWSVIGVPMVVHEQWTPMAKGEAL